MKSHGRTVSLVAARDINLAVRILSKPSGQRAGLVDRAEIGCLNSASMLHYFV